MAQQDNYWIAQHPEGTVSGAPADVSSTIINLLQLATILASETVQWKDNAPAIAKITQLFSRGGTDGISVRTLMDESGGSQNAQGGIQEVTQAGNTGSADLIPVKNNFATLSACINEIRTCLVSNGLLGS